MHILDILSTILLVAAQILTVFLAARGNRLTWILSIIVGLVLCYNFLTEHLYLSMGFQIYSIAAAVFGVLLWKKQSEENKRAICWGNIVYPLLVVLLVTAVVFPVDVLLHAHPFPDSGTAMVACVREALGSLCSHTATFPASLILLDCLIPALQAVATFLMVRKDLNAWILFIIVDFIYIPLGIISRNYNFLPISLCFLATAIYGLIVFHKAYKKRTT